MSNVNYSIYVAFTAPVQNLLPRLPQALQDYFNQVMENEVYGTPSAPKDGQLLKFAFNDDKEQIITHLSIMIECVSILYQAMHGLGPFASRSELGKQMRARVNLFIANKEWNAAHVLNLKIKGSVDTIRNTFNTTTQLKVKLLCWLEVTLLSSTQMTSTVI